MAGRRGSRDPAQAATAFRRVALGFSMAVTPFARFDLPASQDLPDTTPVLFAVNHRSMFDTVAGLVCLRRLGRSAAIMANERYFGTRRYGPVLRGVGAIPVDLEGSALRALAAATRCLLEGRNVVIMPEGRIVETPDRGPDGIGDLEPGAAALAKRARVPIVPTALIGTDIVLPMGRQVPDLPFGPRPRVILRLGEPMVVTGRTRAATEELERRLGELVAHTEALYRSPEQ